MNRLIVSHIAPIVPVRVDSGTELRIGIPVKPAITSYVDPLTEVTYSVARRYE